MSWFVRYVLVISYDTSSGVSSAMLHGLTEGFEKERLLPLLNAYSQLSVHPMLLPIALAETQMPQCVALVHKTDLDVFAVETMTGEHPYLHIKPTQAETDFVSMTRKLNGSSTVAGPGGASGALPAHAQSLYQHPPPALLRILSPQRLLA